MALVTRIGASNANSFVSLDQADNILNSIYTEAQLVKWNELTNSQKEHRLILAAKLMAQLPFRGRRVYKNQALPFPRTKKVPSGRTKIGSYLTDSPIYAGLEDEWLPEEQCRRIPDEVKEIQCQIALEVIHPAIEKSAIGDESAGTWIGDVGSFSISGGFSISFDKEGKASGNVFDNLWTAVGGLIFVKLHRWLSQVRGGAIRSVRDGDFWEEVETLPTTTSTSTTSTTISTTTTTAP